jgi:hypothetical protein
MIRAIFRLWPENLFKITNAYLDMMLYFTYTPFQTTCIYESTGKEGQVNQMTISFIIPIHSWTDQPQKQQVHNRNFIWRPTIASIS